MKRPFHINNDGDAGPCSAASEASCPYHENAGHHGSPEEARFAYEEKMEEARWAERAMGRQYSFPKEQLATAIASVEKANRRAERAGIEERITYEVREYTIEETDQFGMRVVVDRVDFTLNQPEIKHDGWTFVGVMTWDEEAGLITRVAPGQKLLREPQNRLCEVCNQERSRTDTYIVQKDGEEKQVGSSCLKRFMGIKPSGLWMLDADILSKEEFDGEREVSYKADNRRDSREILALALELSEEKGFVSAAMAREGKAPLSTADRVRSVITANSRAMTDEERREIIAKSKSRMNEAEEVLEVARTMEGDSDYVSNLKKLASAETVDGRNLSLLVSAISAKKRKDREAQAKVFAKKSKHVGTIGEKVEPQTVAVESISYSTSYYGGYSEQTTQIVTFKDADGNQLKAFYSGGKRLKKGENIQIVGGKIKKHGEWNGAKETVLERVKFKDARPDVKPVTRLAPESNLFDTWTRDELDEQYKQAHKSIVAEAKRSAGRGGWDKDREEPHADAPNAQEISQRLNEAKTILGREYRIRADELDGVLED